jgi:hypothetical protein
MTPGEEGMRAAQADAEAERFIAQCDTCEIAEVDADDAHSRGWTNLGSHTYPSWHCPQCMEGK